MKIISPLYRLRAIHLATQAATGLPSKLNGDSAEEALALLSVLS